MLGIAAVSEDEKEKYACMRDEVRYRLASNELTVSNSRPAGSVARRMYCTPLSRQGPGRGVLCTLWSLDRER